jgi:PKD repeat protein
MKNNSSAGYRLDEQVYLTMGAVCVIALLVLAFRYNATHACYPINILPTSANFAVGNLVTFRADTREGRTFEWNFGDGATTKEEDPVTLHTYNRAGKYTVVVTVDGQCTEMQVVDIKEAPIVINTSLPPNILGPDTAYVGKPVRYEDGTSSSTAWAWHFEGTSMVNAFTKEASYIYTTPGPRKIVLQVNHRPELFSEKVIIVIDPNATAQVHNQSKNHGGGGGTQIIKVHDSPTTPPINIPDIPKANDDENKPKPAPNVSDDKLQSMLLQVIDGTMVQDDFATYLCNNLNMVIKYNGESKTFSAMCTELKQLKRKRVKKITVTQTKDKTTNCILTMDVTVQKKNILGF